jgi:hypothetical protein
MQTIAYRLVRDDVMVFMAANQAPAEREWNDYVRVLEDTAKSLRASGRSLRFMAFVDESQPNAKQRAAVVDNLGGLQTKTATITSSLLARNVITVFSWLGLTVRGFAPANLEAAVDYLALTRGELEHIMENGRELSANLGGVASFEEAVKARSVRVSKRA